VAIIHEGKIVAMDSPPALLATLGHEILELRLNGNAGEVLRSLQVDGFADGDGFAVGSTLTLPVRGQGATAAIARIGALGLAARSISTRQPTLDDVYLRLTGGRLADAA
jgi:ABC-2 type transport system ATP-binding protein